VSNRSILSLCLALFITGTPLVGFAQSAPSAMSATEIVGRTVIDVNGKTLGVVDRALTTTDGRVRQVLVKTRKGTAVTIRTLSVNGLRTDGERLATALTAEEFESVPASSQD
jgi:sporulation protein YlmC with PRC-barrel domain